jgi:hypothetical protein
MYPTNMKKKKYRFEYNNERVHIFKTAKLIRFCHLSPGFKNSIEVLDVCRYL